MLLIFQMRATITDHTVGESIVRNWLVIMAVNQLRRKLTTAGSTQLRVLLCGLGTRLMGLDFRGNPT